MRLKDRTMLVVLLLAATLCSIIPTNHAAVWTDGKGCSWYSTYLPCEGPRCTPYGAAITRQHPRSGSSYSNNECTGWYINTTPPYRLVFDRFDTEDGYDYVEINGQRYSGSNIPSPLCITQTGLNGLEVTFKSDGSVTKSGFKFRTIKGNCNNRGTSGWTKVGEGHYQHYDGYNWKYPLSLSYCKRYCSNLGRNWNVVQYTYNNQRCTCYKNARGNFVRQTGQHTWRIG